MGSWGSTGGGGGGEEGREDGREHKTKEDEDEGRGTRRKRTKREGELSQMHASGALHNLSTAVLHSFVSPTCLIPRLPVSFHPHDAVLFFWPPESRQRDFLSRPSVLRPCR